MSNKPQIKETSKHAEPTSQPGGKLIDKKAKSSNPPVAETGKKKKVPAQKSSAIAAAAIGQSAVDKVRPNSGRDVRGSNGLTNTGTIISYDE